MQSDEIPEPACLPGTRSSLLLREVDVAPAVLQAAPLLPKKINVPWSPGL